MSDPGGSAAPGAARRVAVESVRLGEASAGHDQLAVEEPLELRLSGEVAGRRSRRSIAITMRTPGADFELAAGFLFSEGIVDGPEAISRIAHCYASAAEEGDNVVEVTLAPGFAFDPERLSRNVYTTSSCGVCGKASLELLRAALPRTLGREGRFSRALLPGLPARLTAAQPLFESTGGLHAAALFDPRGELVSVREDVGRHNALDKLVGALLLAGELPATGRLLLLSGRASFELVQKAAMAGIEIVASVGAPSSLAVESASELGQTLVGFLRGERYNVYCGAERLTG